EGYTLDDNARALITVLRYHRMAGDPEALELAVRYLSFILYCQLEDGWFHNDVGYDRRFLDERAPEEPVGRALWALAEATRAAEVEGLQVAALRMLLRSLPWADRFTHLRPTAYVLLGIACLDQAPGRLPKAVAGQLRQLAERLGHRMVRAFYRSSGDGWQWFEPRLTYCNACLPHGLLAAWQVTGERRFLEVARMAADFAWAHLWDGRVMHVVGNRGWWARGGQPARYDQQPVDAGAAAELAAALYAATGDLRYLRRACLALEWFYGRNVAGVPMYDEVTGGCRDGLGPEGPNPNQGAEATLSHLMARMAVEQALTQAQPHARVAMA
ncbi:MAG TPA: hypothetical protein VIL11_08345, partial [Limnochordales bacterium]